MKKSLFAALLLGSLILVGCDPDQKKNNPSDTSVTAIKISPSEATLNLGESIRLDAALTPADATATVAWSSSDESVATVTEKGFVFASDENYGECYIYAKVGDLKDSCLIKVLSPVSAVIFNSAFVGATDTTYYVDGDGNPIIREIQASSGETYRAYIAQTTVEVFSDGFYVNNSGYLDGATEGVILELEAPMFYATAWLNGTERGTIFCLGEWVVSDTSDGYMRQCLPGSIDKATYMQQMKGFVSAFNADPEDGGYVTFLKGAAAAIKNPTLSTYWVENIDGQTGYVSSYIPDAICQSARFSLNANFPVSDYMCGLDYSEVKFQVLSQDTVFGYNWGVNLNYNAETGQIGFNDEEVHFDAPLISKYNEVPAEAPAVNRVKAVNATMLLEHPEMAARVREQIANHPRVIKLNRK